MIQAHQAILCHSTVKISPIVEMVLPKIRIKLVFCEQRVQEMSSVMMEPTVRELTAVMTTVKLPPMAPAEPSMAQDDTMLTIVEIISPEGVQDSVQPAP